MGNNNQKKNHLSFYFTGVKIYNNNNKNDDFLTSYITNYQTTMKKNQKIKKKKDMYDKDLLEFCSVKKRLSTNDAFQDFCNKNFIPPKNQNSTSLNPIISFTNSIKHVFNKKNKGRKDLLGLSISQLQKNNTILSQRTNISENSSISLLNTNQMLVTKKNLSLNKINKVNSNQFIIKKNNFFPNVTPERRYSISLPFYNPALYNRPQIKEDKESLPIYISKHFELNYDQKIKRNEERIYGLFIKKPKNFSFIGTKEKENKIGFGVVKWEDNSKLLGKFNNNKINSISYFINELDQTTFKGYYTENKPLGFGIYHSKNDDLLCQGEWINNKLNGIGVQLWNHSNFFYGEFKDNTKEGIGTVRFEDGTIYNGEFKNNNIEGVGMIYYEGKDYYEGEFKNGIIHGFGRFIWSNGKRYIGHYNHGIKNGFGIYINDIKGFDGIIGFWNKGKLNGPCISFKKNKIYYYLFHNGLRYKNIKAGIFCLNYLTNNNRNYRKIFDMNENKLIKFIKSVIQINDISFEKKEKIYEYI